MDNLIEISSSELFVIRDALEEGEAEDFDNALAIVEGLLYDNTKELEFNE